MTMKSMTGHWRLLAKLRLLMVVRSLVEEKR